MFDGFKNWLPFKRDENGKAVPQAGQHHHLADFRAEIDRMFEKLMTGEMVSMPSLAAGRDGWFGDFSPSGFTPSVDIGDDRQYIKVTADLPGMDVDDIELDMHDGALVIRGEKKLEESTEEEGYYRTERAYGSFHRVIPMPTDVDADKAEAEFKNGVLTVRLPKLAAKETGARRIEIGAGK